MAKVTSWRYILALLCFLGLFAAGAILVMLFWMTDRIDQVEHQKTHALVELNVASAQEQLRLSVEDNAFWTLAYELVQAGDSAGILDNIGSSATNSTLFDQLFILNAKGELMHAFDEELGAQAYALFDEASIEPVWAELNAAPAQDEISAGSLLEYGGGFALVVAAWIIPEIEGELPDTQYPALVGVITLDESRLTALMRDAQINAANLSPYVPGTLGKPVDDRLTLYDLYDAPVATLTWSVLSSGAALRRELMPSVLLMTFGIFGICAIAARYFHCQNAALEQARLIATTDQLTGLLNRAGLAEKLSQKDMLCNLDRGHLAAIYLDLNKFKVLNDTYGHLAGDIALRVTAERLQAAVGKFDIVTRLGGDEFACVVIDTDPENAAKVIAQRILDLAAAPIPFEGHDQIVTPSIGVAAAAPGTGWDTVLSQSDAAMFWSKQRNASYPVVFRKSMAEGNIQMATVA